MEKALLITGADFSENALTRVVIVEDDKSCTNVELSQTNVDLSDIGATATLTATLTPSDTDDTLTWSSDNPNITVNNGVITAVGVGTATITATCGNATALCTVTATKTINTSDYTVQNGHLFFDFTSTKDMVRIAANALYSLFYSNVNVLDGYKAFSDYDTDYAFISSAFPIPLPLGTSKIRVAKPSNANGAMVALFNSQEGSSYFAQYPTRQGAKCLDSMSLVSFDSTGHAEFNVTVDNADSFAIQYRLNTSGADVDYADIVFM